MAALGTELNRPEVIYEDIAKGMNDLMLKLQSRLNQKGHGAYASRHEILGIITEEYQEIVEAVRDDSYAGYDHFRKELLDMAVAGIYGYICMGDYIKP